MKHSVLACCFLLRSFLKRLVSTSALLIIIATSGFSQSPATFRHPGIMSSQAELDFIKTTVASNNGSPIIAGYNVLANDSRGSLSYNPEPYAVVTVIASGSGPQEDAFRRDGHATYIQAMKWVVTGDVAYRNKAIQIMNAWSSIFQGLTSSSSNQPTLEASWALPIWIAGAEIIKTYNNGAAGWAAADVTKFDSFVNKILGYVNGPLASAPNWIISKGLSLMSAGVFLNNSSFYNSGYNLVQGQIDGITSTGDIPELNRDFVHSQYVLIGLAQSAEVAHQQGSDALFTRTNGTTMPRLLLGAEAYVKGLLGTGTPNYQSASGWARHSAPYEILLARYTELGMDVPQTQNYVLNQNRSENGSEDHFIGWLSATHAQLPPKVPKPYLGSPAPIPGKIEAENYDLGGQGVAYNDLTTGNTGNVFRTDDVDIQATTDPGNGYAIGWIAAGEWLAYTVNVTTAGPYTLTARVSAIAAGKTFHVELDGQNISGTITVPNTTSFQTYSTVTVTTTNLTVGQKVLRIIMDSSSFNINYLNFVSNAPGLNLALNKTATSSSIEAAGFEASSAVDGSATTRWSSAFSDPQWIYVDLGATYNVNRVKITWEAAYATAYQVQVSTNASTWTTIKSVTGNTTLVNDQTGLSGTGRYVRINGTARATVYGYSIFELEVYGTSTGARSFDGEENFSANMDNEKSDISVSVFPNPVTDRVTVQLGGFWHDGNISLHNANGTALVRDQIKSAAHTFDLSHLPAGLYLINVSNSTNHLTKKIVKK